MNTTRVLKVMRKHGLRVISYVVLPALLVQTTGIGFIASALPAQAAATDTDFHFPTATHTPNDWSNAANAFSNNGQYATETNESQEQGYAAFGFPTIPADATIDGIHVRAEAKSSPDTSGCVLRVNLSWNNGGNYLGTWKEAPLTGSDTVVNFGGAADTWGRTWVPGNFSNANFVTKIEFDDQSGNSCGSTTVSVDYLEVNVHYTDAPTLPDPLPNPPLGQSCGLDMALVIDSSGSINETELAQMKTAFNGFVSAFLPGTPTQMSVTEFDTTADVRQTFTSDASLITAAINGATSGGYTNWDDGLAKAQSTYDPRPAKPNLVVFASDGNPNKYGNPAQPDGGALDEFGAMSAAITRANAIKTAGTGTRILALGIGDDLDLENLKRISGPVVNSGTASDVITSSFDTLAADLAALADDLCGGHILVQKKLDLDGDGDIDLDGSVADPRLAGWTFEVDSDPPVELTTPDTGLADFSVLAGTYELTETSQIDGTELVSAACVKGDRPIGIFNLDLRLISDLVMGADETISCEFVNRVTDGTLRVVKQVVGGTAQPSDWSMHVRYGDNSGEVPGSPQPGSPSGTDYTLPGGVYIVFESDGPGGYSQTLSPSCENNLATVTPGALTVCTITNTFDTGTLTVNKWFDDDGDGDIDRENPAGWTWDILNGEQNNTAGETVVLQPGIYTVIEDLDAGYFAEWICNDNTRDQVQTPGEGPVMNVTIATGQNLECTFTNTLATGSVLVNKMVDANGDRTFEGGNEAANQLGFRWGLDDETPSRNMGTLAKLVPAGNHTVSEASVPNYHFVGWFRTSDEERSCSNPEGSTLPVPIEVVRYGQTTVTLCNAVNATATTLTKTAPTTVTAGDLIGYTMGWSVTGNAAADNAVITDVLPANTTFVSATCGTTPQPPACSVAFDSGTNTVTWQLGTRTPGATGTVVLNVRTATPLANGTLVSNTASFDTAATDPVTASAQTTVASQAVLNVSKTGLATAAPGASVTYTLNWSVGGNSPATNLVLTDTLPTSLTFVSASQGGVHNGTNPGGIVTWNLGNKVPGNSGSVTLTVTTGASLTNTTVITNTASLDAQETDPVTATATTRITAGPTLGVSKSVNLPFANPGDQPTYSVTVTNTGNDAAINATLTDTLPAGFTFVDGAAAAKTFALGTLAKGTSTTVTYAVAIATSVAAGTYDNTATAKADNHGPVTAKAPLEVRIPVVAGVSTPSFTISKEVNKKTANPGDTLIYTINVTNSGDADISDLRLTDTLPSDFVFADTGSQKRIWTIATLFAGETRTITYEVTVEEDAKAGKHENTVVALVKDLDPQTAKAAVDVRVPKVLGALTETGAPLANVIALFAGLTITVLSGIGFRRSRRFAA